MIIRKNLVHEPSEGFDCVSPSRTVQEFKTECDVNVIIDNYTHTGVLSHVNKSEPIYGDFSEIPKDYGEMINLLNDSKAKFDSLPSKVRERFDNDPAKMIQFLQDENNRNEAYELGLVNKPAEKPAEPAEPVEK